MQATQETTQAPTLNGLDVQRLEATVEALKAYAASASYALEGHADATGPEAYNHKLGLRRAEAVQKFLSEQHHIAVDRISVVSYGENQPAAPNDSRDGRAKNRRVVLTVEPK